MQTKAILLLAAAMLPALSQAAGPAAERKLIERGRYLVKVGGCNDCHTAGYGPAAGAIDERHWLTGDALGWRGPWGTTYPTNLRLKMQQWSEQEWLAVARHAQMRPPMPWFTLRDMRTEDLRAVYHYVRHLGPAGTDAPSYVPPDSEPTGPYVQFPMPRP